MQQITITGWLSRDAETSTTQGGDTVTRWSIPVKQGFGEREQTNWYRVSIWGKRADFAAKAMKGDFAAVTGELTIGDYQGKPQYEIRAVDFHTSRSSPRDGSQGGERQRTVAPDAFAPTGVSTLGGVADMDDDIPF